MTETPAPAGQPRWQTWVETYVARFQGPGIQVGQMVKLWAISFSVVMLACAVFFLPLVWLFS